MQQTDNIVSGWLGGSESIDGYENPAGPLYIEGTVATEVALTTDSGTGMNAGGSNSSCSMIVGHCFCC